MRRRFPMFGFKPLAVGSICCMALFACGSTSDDQSRLGEAGEACTRTADCQAPLRCIAQVCVAPGGLDAQTDTDVHVLNDAVPYELTATPCGSDTLELRWHTREPTTAVVRVTWGEEEAVCESVVPAREHWFGDILTCRKERTPGGTGGKDGAAGAEVKIEIYSQVPGGEVGEKQAAVAMPRESCFCVDRSGTPCTYPGLPPCGLGLELESGALVAPENADFHIEVDSDFNAYLVAPGGLQIAHGTAMCDALEAPEEGYVGRILWKRAEDGNPGFGFAERADTIFLKTRTGLYAKVSLECACPTPAGIRFGYQLAKDGTRTF